MDWSFEDTVPQGNLGLEMVVIIMARGFCSLGRLSYFWRQVHIMEEIRVFMGRCILARLCSYMREIDEGVALLGSKDDVYTCVRLMRVLHYWEAKVYFHVL